MTANLHSDHEAFGGLAASTYNSNIYTPPASGDTIHRIPSLLKGQHYGLIHAMTQASGSNSYRNSPFTIIPHTITASHLRDYPHAIANEDEDLFLEVKQYIPDRQISFAAGSGRGDKTINDDAVTIIAAGGIGFIKELYEPLFEELLLRAESAGFSIRAIWMADPVNTGASAVRNQANLGCDPSWWDHSRDLWAMINYLRREMVQPVMGLGHSMGANQLAYISHWHPRFFTSFVFVEAGIDPNYGRGALFPWMKQTLRKRESWPNRVEAETALLKNPSFRGWDPRVMARVLEHGIYLYKNGGIEEWRLTTPKHQEAATVLRPSIKDIDLKTGGMDDVTLEERAQVPDLDPSSWNPQGCFRPEVQNMWNLLLNVRPWVMYINGGSSPYFGDPKIREERAKLTGTGVGGSGGIKLGAVEQVVIEGGAHTIPFDANLGKVATHAAEWIGREMKRWANGEKKRRDEWRNTSLEEKQTVAKGLLEAIEKRSPNKSKL